MPRYTVRLVVPISLALLCSVAAAQSPELGQGPPTGLNRSAIWAPYEYDAGTIQIYHFDEKSKSAATGKPGKDPLDGDLPSLDDEDDGGDSLLETTADATGRSAAPAMLTDKPARLAGRCELVADGKFGGALKLDGGDGMLVCDGLSAVTGQRVVEAWVKPAKPAGDEAAVFCLAAPVAAGLDKPATAALTILPDGTGRLHWNGKLHELGGLKITFGQWQHLALAVSSELPYPNTARVFRNGELACEVKLPAGECGIIANRASLLSVGNLPSGKSGLTGLVDELRISRNGREFFSMQLDRFDPKRKADAPAGPPIFRDEKDLRFRLDFNGKLEPTVAPGKVKVTVAPQRSKGLRDSDHFPDGVEGQGLLNGSDTPSPHYTCPDVLLTSGGTIAFWMRPADWDNYLRDNRFDNIPVGSHSLFYVTGTHPQGSFQGQFHDHGVIMSLGFTRNLDEGAVHASELHPGRWIHLAITWQDANFITYADGELDTGNGAWSLWWLRRTAGNDNPYENNPKWWPLSRADGLVFDKRWENAGFVPHTIVDDFRIYSRPLSPNEIANLAALYPLDRKPAPLPPVTTILDYNGVLGTVDIKAFALMRQYAQAARARVTVRRQGDDRPVGVADAPLGPDKSGRVHVDTPPLEFASYEVKTEILDEQGKTLASADDRFTRKPPAWWGCTAGKSDKVMAPWTPMTGENDTIRLWGREIHLAGSGLPRSIVSAGEDILAGPIALTASAGGKAIDLKPAATAKITGVKEVRVDAEGELSAGDFDIRTTSYTEFDGMMWLRVALDPKVGKKPTLDRLTIRIPYRADSAELMHLWSGERNFRSGKCVEIDAVPPGQGVLFRSDANDVVHAGTQRGTFVPYLALLGMKRGMAWFAENDRGWTQTPGTPAVTLEREGDTVTLVLNVIAEPVTLDGERAFEFGLHSVPVKPMPQRWRNRPRGYTTMMPDSFSGNNLKGGDGTEFYLLPENQDWEAVKRRIGGEGRSAASLQQLSELRLATFKKRYGRDPEPIESLVPGLYWDLNWMANYPPDTREWVEAWGGKNRDYVYYTSEFNDFVAWVTEQWIVKTDGWVRGIYMDDCWNHPQSKLPGPVAYQLPDGHVQPGFQWRGFRERIKRTRQLYRDYKLGPHLVSHTTHTYFIPYHSFFDVILDGEDKYANDGHDPRDFMDKWSLPRMRFNHYEKWGQIMAWLSWIGGPATAAKQNPKWGHKQDRAYMAMMALHEISWNFGQSIEDEFGIHQPDVVNLPYWDNQHLASHKHDPDQLKITAWKRPGQCLVMLVNVGNDRLEAEVKLDPKVMGFGDVPAERIAIHHDDPTLLKYFDQEDPTAIKVPDKLNVDLPTDGAGVKKTADDLGLSLEEAPQAKRGDEDPDAAYDWSAGTLTCPIRRHDFRLFLLRPKP